MLETYDSKWAEKWDAANASYKALEAIPFQSRSPEQHQRMKDLAHVQTLAFDAQFKTANELIRFQFDTLYDRQFRQYGEVMACPVLSDDADYDDARLVLRDFASRLEQTQRDAGSEDRSAAQAAADAAMQAAEEGGTVIITRREVQPGPLRRLWRSWFNRGDRHRSSKR